ncbi:ArgR family transcriptional regulator [Vagococcus carniphilus]|uniref:arginine repressor n=1 Tax=Vagococcus carniphilus TaxID=218144 RepID=UPI00288EE124|nr:ArgR family transcriptional regulator [Vagococcus carniphilus]MDT2829873.1 ArgR family transcriptional regulator [Vagococcus carniphilus]MDT2838307.1 ArgR family transcriptional regulator [Vagococcus carniphilus]MDT2854303.1 ArgR family transcriptional regulator [Vagococcus carniphilus]
MRKQERHRWIEKIITEKDVTKQEELVALLLERNIPVTQATISRDIKEMKLVKVPNSDKIYKYNMPTKNKTEQRRLEKLLKNAFVDITQMDKMISLTTKPGSGFALGNLIDEVYNAEIFTVMSNDDKILIITKTEKQAVELEKKLLEIV